MCNGFDYQGIDHVAKMKSIHDAIATDALTDAMDVMLKAHHDVDCNNIQQYVIELEDKSTLKMDLLPVISDTCVCYMYPIDPVCLGEDDKYLISSDAIPCQAAMFDGIQHPEKYVIPPKFSTYRSLCGNDGGGGTEVNISEVALPEGSCVKNTDGSVTFTLKLSTIVMTDADPTAYNLAMGKACCKELLRNMEKNGVDSFNMFAMREDDPSQVDPEAMINFLDMLLPNLIPGKDIVVGIPAFDENGTAKSAAFSVWFHYPEGVEYLPLLGLVHNVDPSDTNLTSKVEGNFYIATNKKCGIGAVDEGGGGLKPISLCSHQDFLPQMKHEPYQSDFDKYNSIEYCEPFINYSAWCKAISAFQKNCQSSVWDTLEGVVKKNGLPGFDKSVMLTANLKGLEFPKHTMTMCRDNASRKEAHAVAEEVELEDLANNKTKVHSIMARVNSDEWDAIIVSLVKGMDSNYFNDQAIGLSRFNLELMTAPHVISLRILLERVMCTD